MTRSKFLLVAAMVLGLVGAGARSALALPSLQLGPGTGTWTYDAATQTWVTPDNPLNLTAVANATAANGGNGDYAWSVNGSTQIAYLVVSAVPKTASSEPPTLFDITVSNDGGNLALYSSGNGAPPLSDPNDLAPHGIFDTYFELYEFNFDGSLTDINNTVTGTDTGKGYLETFDITINSLSTDVKSLHFDLFTIQGSGHLGATDQVEANAPFSHDAQTIPEPSAVLLFGIGSLIAGTAIRRRR